MGEGPALSWGKGPFFFFEDLNVGYFSKSLLNSYNIAFFFFNVFFWVLTMRHVGS